MPNRFKGIPESPFMVAAVFEGLKTITCGELQNMCVSLPRYAKSPELQDEALWRTVVEIVPGEADIFCAAKAREVGAMILTGDSDLLVPDLGPQASVCFFDDVKYEPPPRSKEGGPENLGRLKALAYKPSSISEILGVSQIAEIACLSKSQPGTPFRSILEQARSRPKSRVDSKAFSAFMAAYDLPITVAADDAFMTRYQDMDPRISELILQFTLDTFDNKKQPYMYLPIVIEDHDRQCVWNYGIAYRDLAYSILNLSVPKARRHQHVLEHFRRGHRVAPREAQTLNSETCRKTMGALTKHCQSARRRYIVDKPATDQTTLYETHFWPLYALSEISKINRSCGRPALGTLSKEAVKRFFTRGRIGNMLSWEDLHLRAQLEAVLYSLRILKQILDVAIITLADGIMGEAAEGLRGELKRLPSLGKIEAALRGGIYRIRGEERSDDDDDDENDDWNAMFECVWREIENGGEEDLVDDDEDDDVEEEEDQPGQYHNDEHSSFKKLEISSQQTSPGHTQPKQPLARNIETDIAESLDSEAADADTEDPSTTSTSHGIEQVSPTRSSRKRKRPRRKSRTTLDDARKSSRQRHNMFELLA